MTATAPLSTAPNRYDLLSDTHVEFEGDIPYVWPEDRASARLILAGDIGSIGGGTWLRFLQTPEVSSPLPTATAKHHPILSPHERNLCDAMYDMRAAAGWAA